MDAKFCPRCGSPRIADMRYCADCGLDLNPPLPASEPPPSSSVARPRSRGTPAALLILGGLLAFLAPQQPWISAIGGVVSLNGFQVVQLNPTGLDLATISLGVGVVAVLAGLGRLGGDEGVNTLARVVGFLAGATGVLTLGLAWYGAQRDATSVSMLGVTVGIGLLMGLAGSALAIIGSLPA